MKIASCAELSGKAWLSIRVGVEPPFLKSWICQCTQNISGVCKDNKLLNNNCFIRVNHLSVSDEFPLMLSGIWS